MNNRRTWVPILGFILLCIVAVVGLTWVNYRFAAQESGGNNFLPCWASMRLFLIEGWSPYSPETSQEIQRLVSNGSSSLGKEPAVFVYPFYTILICGPFALIEEFTLARALWMTTLEICLVLVLVFSIRLSQWHPSMLLFTFLLLFTMVWFHSLRSVVNGSLIVWVILMIVAAMLAIRAEQDAVAGSLLAVTSIELPMVILFLIFVLIWAISRRRWNLFISITGALLLLIAGMSLLISDWVLQSIRQLVEFYKTTFLITPGKVLSYWLPGIGHQVGWLLSISLTVIILWQWRVALGKDFRWFLWTGYVTLTATTIIGIPTSLDRYLVLLPGIVYILAVWDQRWGRVGTVLVWISLLMFTLGLWGLVLSGAHRGIPLDLDPLLFFLSPVFAMAGLYWVRWRAFRPDKLPLEAMAEHVG